MPSLCRPVRPAGLNEALAEYSGESTALGSEDSIDRAVASARRSIHRRHTYFRHTYISRACPVRFSAGFARRRYSRPVASIFRDGPTTRVEIF